LILEVKAVRSFATAVTSYQWKQCNITEDPYLQQRRFENPKLRKTGTNIYETYM